MIAYKFLAAGAVGPFSRFAWPTGSPGPWVESEPTPCAAGIHGCAVADLPFWLHEELWEAELDAPLRLEHKLVSRRGRLLRRVEGWNAESARAFAQDCATRAHALIAERGDSTGAGSVFIGDLDADADAGKAAVSGFIAARVAELVAGPAGYDAERTVQAAWLARRLGLVDP